jgi:mandelate racemase
MSAHTWNGQQRRWSRRSATLARLCGVYPELSGHLLRVTPTRHWLEWQDWANPVLRQPFEVRSGQLHVPDVPGNGLDWDEDAVARYRAEP